MSDNENTPLHDAAIDGNLKKIKAILNSEAIILNNALNAEGKTPIFYAVTGGHDLVVKALIDSGANLNLIDYYGRSILDYAYDNPKILNLLKEAGAIEPSITDLQKAIWANNLPRVEKAISENIESVNIPNFHLQTPLHLAIRMNNIEIVTLLLKKGANPNQDDKTGHPPIWYANDFPELKKVLLKYGAHEFDDSMTPPDLSATLLHLVCNDDEFDNLENMCDINEIINNTNRFGNTALHLAIINGNLNYVEYLLNKGASLDLIDTEGWSPLHLAVINNQPEIVKALIEGGADVNAQDYNGLTPLLQAVIDNATDIIEILLKHGADPEITDYSQMNMIDHAKINSKHTELSKELKKHIELSKDYLEKFKASFEPLLKAQLLIAKQQNKKILIILLEIHGKFKIYQIQKQILILAKEQGIENLYIESSDEHPDFAIDKIAKNKLSMEITPVDTHPGRINNEYDISLKERNVFIADNIHKKNRDGIFITGAEHIMGLLTHDESKIDPNQYHIVPINLTSLYPDFGITNNERRFSRNEEMVIQVTQTDKCLSSSEQVLAKWNNTKNETYRNSPNKKVKLSHEVEPQPSPVLFQKIHVPDNKKNDITEADNQTNQMGTLERIFNFLKKPW